MSRKPEPGFDLNENYLGGGTGILPFKLLEVLEQGSLLPLILANSSAQLLWHSLKRDQIKGL